MKNDDQVTVRDIRLNMEQDAEHRGTFDFSGRVNRDQRDLALSFSGTVDASDYPHNLTAGIEQLRWQLQGADLPAQGIEGQGQLQAQWQEAQKRLSFNHLNLTANDSSLTGHVQVTLAEQPEWQIDLRSSKLNLDNLLPHHSAVAQTGGAVSQGQNTLPLTRPVIASRVGAPPYQGLQSFTAEIVLQADSASTGGEWTLPRFRRRCLIRPDCWISPSCRGNWPTERYRCPARLTPAPPVRASSSTLASTMLRLGNYPEKPLIIPISLTGKMSLVGDFSGADIDAEAFRHSWKGKAHVDMSNTRLEGMNFQQLVQQAVERSGGDAQQSQENMDNATRLDRFTTDLTLNKGTLTLDDMVGQSSMLALTGSGTLDLVKQSCDTQFNLRCDWAAGTAIAT